MDRKIFLILASTVLSLGMISGACSPPAPPPADTPTAEIIFEETTPVSELEDVEPEVPEVEETPIEEPIEDEDQQLAEEEPSKHEFFQIMRVPRD